MRFLWVLFFLGIFRVGLAGYSIAFVHMGEEIPPSLFIVMKQARYLNPGCRIYLLTDNEQCLGSSNRFKEENIELVNIQLLTQGEEHKTFEVVNKIDKSISEGLWLYATKRFFTLLDFMRERGLEQVFHLENDSMLYANLEKMMPLFEKHQLAAPFQSLVGCIPCFVFIRDAAVLEQLTEYILEEMRNYQGPRPFIRLNDMQTLASFYRKGGEITPLPTLMPAYHKFYAKRKSRFLEDNKTDLRFLSMNASLFPGYIFDAAGLGIFLNGNDRKHHPDSGPGAIHSRVLFNPRFFSYSWELDEEGRRVPYLCFKEEKYQIVNLHFHSKMVDDYTSF